MRSLFLSALTMDSPSRNPLLLDQQIDENSSEDESNDDGVAAPTVQTVKESYRRASSTPIDRYNFAYVVFYILGM